jgi:protein-export membrane protein SecD/preprotein translocase SecF subunit
VPLLWYTTPLGSGSLSEQTPGPKICLETIVKVLHSLMEQRTISIFIGIILLTAALVWVVTADMEYTYPTTAGAPQEAEPTWAAFLPWQGEQQRSVKVHQGLDLQGGLQVVLEADMPPNQELQEGSMEAARVIVDNRVNGLGVTEPLVQLQGENRIIVELPGISDPDLAVSTIKETGLLEFVDAGGGPIPDGTLISTSLGGPLTVEDGESATEEANIVSDTVYETIITGGDLAEVSNAGLNPNSRQVEINFSLTSDGGQKFGEYTGQNVGNYLCIVVDKMVLSCPVVNARIDTNGTISLGQSGLDEGQGLAIQLRYGALPVPLQVVENRSVGPTLGQDSVQRSVRAGTIGLLVVLLFMIVYYRLPGTMAALALVVYGLLNFSLYKLIPVTLTLPAITGFILSVGMAVDANILIFERMKEELRSGKSLKFSMELGFSRSWPSIRDSAISTLITCVILFWFGTNFGASIVKGFAITLALGVVTNIFTAITVTRTFLRMMLGVSGEGLKDNAFLLGYRPPAEKAASPAWVSNLLDIVGKRKYYYIFSTVVIGLGIAAMIVSSAQFGSPLKLSIDFTSGSLMELQFEEQPQPAAVRDIFGGFSYEGVDFNDTSVTTAEQLGRQTILIRSKYLDDEAKTAVQNRLEEALGPFTELRFDSVGPTIGQEVTRAGTYAVLAAAVAILIFFILAFRSVPNAFRYGIAAIVAMFHDIFVTAGLFAVFGIIWGWEMDALFLTAILTVIGYSVHDTIIVFDRIRENMPRYRSEQFEIVCNRSLLETLTRSVITSVSTAFVVIAILAFGGTTIQQFVTIILIGVISGTYSSIFTAVPILVSWQQGELGAVFRRRGNTPANAQT